VNSINLSMESFDATPAMNVGVSHALLEAVAAGVTGETFRLHQPGPVMAFGMADRIQPRYDIATRIARAHGFEPVERLAGGRAAVFHELTLAFSWAVREENPAEGITKRFQFISKMVNDAFRSLGLDSRIGEIPGEYCPGTYSVNVGGTVKVMGVGQRLVKGAAHVGGVIVVDGAARIRDVLIPTYRALGIDWDPRTTGALADRAPGLTSARVLESVVSQLETRFDVSDFSMPEAVVERGATLASSHLARVA
jgi:octanoyl-[GcvH]:protein N-octanoyltransferase